MTDRNKKKETFICATKSFAIARRAFLRLTVVDESMSIVCLLTDSHVRNDWKTSSLLRTLYQ